MNGETAVRALSLETGGGAGAADAVTLTWEDRWRRRGRLVTEGGEAFLLDLAEATELCDGDALLLQDGRRIAVRAAPEPLVEVRGDDATHLARLAWHLGNRHLPVQIEAGRLLIRRDHVLEDMLARLGATMSPIEAAFRPEGGPMVTAAPTLTPMRRTRMTIRTPD
jgi:urease accessory protein